MNTIETERLVRRIHSILGGSGDPAMAPQLAEQLKAISASIVLRLEQCRAMIEAGAAPQAVQLAETQPNLLDLVTLLEFREADDWRQYCQNKGLPVAEKLNPRAVAMLNECYSRGITPQHPIYAAYREAVLAKNDEAARTALLSIVRLNSADTNATSELTRLDSKILAGRMARLDQCLARDENAVLREMEAIEALGFKTKLSGDIWRRGQLLRSRRLLLEGEDLMVEGALAEVLTRLDWLEQLKVENELQWPEDWNERFTRLYEWFQAESSTRQRNEEYQNLTRQLQRSVRSSPNPAPKRISIAALDSELRSARELYRQLAAFAGSVPSELRQEYEKYESQQGRKLKRAKNLRLLQVGAGLSVAVFILAAMAVALVAARQANGLAAQLADARGKHEVRLLQSLVGQSRGRFLIATPQLKAELTAANAEIAQQMTPLGEFEAAFDKMPSRLESLVTVQQIVAAGLDLSGVEQVQATLAPDLQKETSPKVQDLQKRWAEYCKRMTPAINQQIEQGLESNDVPAHSDSLQDLDQFQTAVSVAIPQVEQLMGAQSNLNKYTTLRSDLASQCSVLLVQLRQTYSNIDDLASTVAALPAATNLSDYAGLVIRLASIPISQSDYKRAAQQARTIQELKDKPEALSARLLAGDDPALWAALAQTQPDELKPAKVKLNVRQKFIELLRDYAINGDRHRFDIFFDAQKSQHQTWITSEALQTDEGWHTVQGWKTDSLGDCEFVPLDYGYFGGHYRLNKDVLYEIDDTSLSDQTGIWNKSGFSSLINPRTMTYNLPPLRVADALCSDHNSSPLLKAYLLEALIGIMQLQPEESGIIFAPGLTNLPAKFREFGTGGIRSGDWFVASRTAAMQPGLGKLFDSLKLDSEENRVGKLMAGLRAAEKCGFAFAGYVKPNGSPYWTGTAPDGFLWGYLQGKGEPGLLYVVQNGHVRTVGKPLPLTPVLLFNGDLPAILSNAGLQNGETLKNRWLPPLFATSLPAP